MQVFYLFCYLLHISLYFFGRTFLLENLKLKKLGLQNWHFYRIKAIDKDYCFDLNLLLL